MPLPTTSAQYVRRAVLKINETTILDTVDSLDLRGNAKISAVIGMPLRSLQQRRDVVTFATTAPLAAVKAMLELLAAEPLERVVAALGEHADTPSFDQLSDAVDGLVANGSTPDDVVALLAFAIGEEFPAAPHCRRLLEERAEFALPELPAAAPSAALLSPKQVDPEVRAQRRARREDEKRRKRNTAPVNPAHPARVKSDKKIGPVSPKRATERPVREPERRRVLLTPMEQERFSAEHPLAGMVVLVEIPFDAVDPTAPDQHAKVRPALVVAASDVGILIRGIYSNPSPTRMLFTPWRRLGFDHLSYIDDSRVALAASSLNELSRLGPLDDSEWNALV
ncbi:MAG: hypothetical protein ABSC34_04805 [Acidimicrobiales bacterium]